VPPEEGVGVGLLGMGVVGSQVAHGLLHRGPHLARHSGRPVTLRRVLVRDPSRARSVRLPAGLLTDDADDVLNAPDIAVVIEVMGGEEPARTYIERAIQAGKHVVTANKEVISKHGPHLFDLARRAGVDLRFEASVGGGIPIINPLLRDLLANEIGAIRAIINGTTNYILTKMSKDGLDFAVALAEAQELGYAEPDPTNDVEGTDAAYKVAILASLAFHTPVSPSDVYREGITHLQPRDFQYAHELGHEIKLLAIARKEGAAVQVRVHPALVPQEASLAKVEGPNNAIEVRGDLVGAVVFSGPGAGAAPTSSAILGDLLVAVGRVSETGAASGERAASGDDWPVLAVEPMADLETRYYVRLNVADRAGVLARIADAFGQHGISVASVIQKDADAQEGTAELVITTHPSREAPMQQALTDLRGLDVVRDVANLLRVESE
jgi:homoserine dehydrogenase